MILSRTNYANDEFFACCYLCEVNFIHHRIRYIHVYSLLDEFNSCYLLLINNVKLAKNEDSV